MQRNFAKKKGRKGKNSEEAVTEDEAAEEDAPVEEPVAEPTPEPTPEPAKPDFSAAQAAPQH